MNRIWKTKRMYILIFFLIFFAGMNLFGETDMRRVHAATCGACGGKGYTVTQDRNRIKRYGCTKCGGQGYQIIHPETLAVLSSSGYKKGSGTVPSHSSGGSGNPAMLNGWVQRDGIWYFYIDNVAQIGWQSIDGPWYYFNDAGQMQTGWIQSNPGEWYYMNPDGSMAVDTVIEGYSLGKDGRLIGNR